MNVKRFSSSKRAPAFRDYSRHLIVRSGDGIFEFSKDESLGQSFRVRRFRKTIVKTSQLSLDNQLPDGPRSCSGDNALAAIPERNLSPNGWQTLRSCSSELF